MATLNELTKKAKSLSGVIADRVSKNAPRKTGRLQEALKKANTFESMVEVEKGTSKQTAVKGIDFNIDYAPTDAPYGLFWNDPTISYQVKNARTKNRNKTNFVDKALNESKVVKTFDELADVIADMVLTDLSKEIDGLGK